MSDVHLTKELLEAVFGDGDLSPADLVPVVMGHLFHLCPECKRAFDSWRDGIPNSAGLSYGEIADNAIQHATQKIPLMRAQEKASRAFLEELLQHPTEEHLERIEQAPKEVKGPALAKGLVEAARDALPGRPKDSLALAQLARTVLQHADLSPLVAELYARAVAYVGNALRILGSLPEAAEVMAHARFILRQEGGGDRLLRSEVDNLEGLVRLHQHDFDEACALLERAVLGFRMSGAHRRMTRSKIDLAIVYLYRENLDLCVQSLNEVLVELESLDEPQLLGFARHNLAVALALTGRFEESAEVLEANRSAFAPGDSCGQARISWLEGILARGYGDLEAAESHFAAARYCFAQLEMPFDVALVSLELALVYLDQRRFGDLRSLAGGLTEVFRGQERYRECFAALHLFHTAVELEKVTADLVSELSVYLRRAALNPRPAFKTAQL